jgi:type IX secretion system PorP/SprF family membrane protein
MKVFWNRIVSFSFALQLFCGVAEAQQTSQFTQYQLNYFALNPAAAGSLRCFEVKVGTRSQWVGFEGAPKTQFVTVNGALPRNKRPWLRSKHAVGFLAEIDQTGSRGPIRTTTLALAYAYHVPIKGDVFFSAGIFAGLKQWTVSMDQLQVFESGDPVLARGSNSAIIYPDFNPGLMLYSDKYYAGLSIKQIWRNDLTKVVGSGASRLRWHYIATGGYRLDNGKGLYSFIPSVNIKYAFSTFPAVDLNFMMNYNRQWDLGVSYRVVEGFCAYTSYTIRNINIGYSFDYTLSKIRFGSANTHEIMVTWRRCPRKNNEEKDMLRCPAWR